MEIWGFGKENLETLFFFRQIFGKMKIWENCNFGVQGLGFEKSKIRRVKDLKIAKIAKNENL